MLPRTEDLVDQEVAFADQKAVSPIDQTARHLLHPAYDLALPPGCRHDRHHRSPDYSAIEGSVTVPGVVMAARAARCRYAAGSSPRIWAVSISE